MTGYLSPAHIAARRHALMSETTWEDRACALIGGALGGALACYWLAWSTGQLIDPTRLLRRLRRHA